MKKQFFRPFILGCMTLALVASGSVFANEQASRQAAPRDKAAKKASKTKSPSKAVTVKYIRGSEETTGERSARLKRECKGAVNAGACAGFTR